ncbi:MAG: hypothetical protein EPO32_14295 [Anaerolineae bacterium]|nr:MAG: hypothetical protein EPO32_14295 [Anaerolineae bacterium]
MANKNELTRTDEALADFVDTLQSGQTPQKDSDMDVRNLQSLAERLHQLTDTYAAPQGNTTRRRMEVFNAYRQTVRRDDDVQGESWVERVFKTSLRSPSLAGAFLTVIVFLAAAVVLAPGGADVAATAGLGDWVVPALALAVAAGLLLAAYFNRRK